MSFRSVRSSRRQARFPCSENAGSVADAESFFFPLDVRLELGTEGFSPAVLQKVVRQASKATSFEDASSDLRELAGINISATHIQRVSERIGDEWREQRDADVAKFRERDLERDYAETTASGAAAVMLDGGRTQTRADDGGRGVTDPAWRETKVACCLTLQTKAVEKDPHPEPPAKFLEPTTAARLTAEIKRRRSAGGDKGADESNRSPGKKTSKKKKRKALRRSRSNKKRIRVRTIIATMANSEAFGWQVAAEVHRRGLDRRKRKGCVCDGQTYNWSVYEMHLLPLGFIAILDFIHLMAYLYDAAHAACSGDVACGWKKYEQWLRLAWSGKVTELLKQLQAALTELQRRGTKASQQCTTLSETVTYVTNNRERMDYPEYRRLGLPTSSAPVESTIKQINRRIKGSEKFWLVGGAESMLQLRAAQLSDDGRWERNWGRPRKHRRSVGGGRLSPAA